MRPNLAQTELLVPQIDVDKFIARLDRKDILLLRCFYVRDRQSFDNTTSYALKLLVEELKTKHKTSFRTLSYSAVRRRLENLKALGLVGKIPRTNPAIYYGIDDIADDVRRLVLRFAAELVGVMPNAKR